MNILDVSEPIENIIKMVVRYVKGSEGESVMKVRNELKDHL